ncbi:polyprenyl diphosphate synthase [Asticcacaulis sp. ZE23SCel15]|uniref:polyprenyl diphosphate synthase n=1 Tax=Asticcacaulis sp. ZE23SCel15 TaxID=3059027 RepID=UPI0026600339|nr:polyprenyl diphosphate synthase [Asticcacaulis sp. ZE23SCel15]WKL56781.1 polyprenyl diphosphate synthase [Asticcacaulis sp. ZE23SCel15]
MPAGVTTQVSDTREADKAPVSPLHVAIIMDGNGRWAKARGQMRTMGHKAGVNALRRTIRAAGDLGVTHMTVFAFSTENWRRPAAEVSDLMGLLRTFIESDLAKLAKEGVCVRIIGQQDGLPKDIVECVRKAHDDTRNNSRFFLQVALNYGAQADVVDAAKRFAAKVKSGDAQVDDLTPEVFGGLLSTHDLPPLDLMIRTSGEHRLSNFLLWEAAYAEFVFQDVLWPDYDRVHLEDALRIFKERDRRFGAVEAGHVSA